MKKTYQAAPEGPHGPLAKKGALPGSSLGGPKVALEGLGAILTVWENVKKLLVFIVF